MAIRYKALTELYQETQRSVTAPDQWRAFPVSYTHLYCIEPGVGVNTGDQSTGRGEDFWDNYPSDLNPTLSLIHIFSTTFATAAPACFMQMASA